MGQYREREENKPLTINAEAKNVSGYPTIIIKKSILKEIKERLKTDIIKIRIHNHIEKIYFWSLGKIDKAASINFRGLKPGRYTLEIEPYNKYDFIREFNELIKERHDITLQIKDEKLRLYIPDKTLDTLKWRFEKEHGGAIHIIAEYPSITRREGKIKIKYQIKYGEAKIYIQEPRTREKREVPYEVTEVSGSETGIVLKYRHGKKLKTSVIINVKSILDLLDMLEIIEPNLFFKYSKDKSLSGVFFRRYEFSVTDNTVSNVLDSLMSTSYKFLRDPNFAEDAKTIRDQIGKFITSSFLRELGYKEIIKDIENKPYYQVRFPYVKPDLVAKIGNEWHIIEVKFRFKESNIHRIIDEAYYQVLRQFSILANHCPIRIDKDQYIDNIKKYGLVIVGYDHRVNRGYLYFHLSKLK